MSRQTGFSLRVRTYLDRLGLSNLWEHHPADYTHVHTDNKTCSTLDQFVCNKRLIDWLFFSSISISFLTYYFSHLKYVFPTDVFPTLSNLYSLYSLVVPPAQIPVETEAAITRWSWVAEIKEWNRPQDFTYKWTYSVKKLCILSKSIWSSRSLTIILLTVFH